MTLICSSWLGFLKNSMKRPAGIIKNKQNEMSEMKHMPPPTLFSLNVGGMDTHTHTHTHTDLSAQRYMSSARAPTEFLNLIYGVAANKQ